jgi:Spy/CpxP family protein refolding chaperone
MVRIQRICVLASALVLGAIASGADAEQGGGRGQRGFGRGTMRGSLIGLLTREEVQKDLNLSEEQVTKVKELGEQLQAEMMQNFTAVQGIEDKDKQRARMMELATQSDRKTRDKLSDILKKEQMARLDQIRLQVRSVVESLTDKDVAGELKLADAQKEKLSQINKDLQTKQAEMLGGMREASREQRTEAFQKFTKLRADADKEALDVLTAEQKQAFEKMKGPKIELEMRRGQR